MFHQGDLDSLDGYEYSTSLDSEYDDSRNLSQPKKFDDNDEEEAPWYDTK
jgi:hypothetical protein